MAKEYTKSENETKPNYDIRCQYLRKVELAKCQIEIEYKLDNIWNSKQIHFTDKIIFCNFAKKYENLKEKRKAEQRERLNNENQKLRHPVSLLKKLKIDEVKVKSVEELTKEVAEIQRKNADYENYKFEDYENYNLNNNVTSNSDNNFNNKLNYNFDNNFNNNSNNNFNNNSNGNFDDGFDYDEDSIFDTIKLEEEKKAKQQEILLEQIRKKQEIKDKKAYNKARKKEEKNKKREEERKNRELKRQKAREEARIEEELLGDNLYPKTKNNKSL